ncbi:MULTISPECIES: RcnB family protein [Paracoccus]|uniref:RcnB family protein n=1 Tax=Paracoccus TaxID=265 RepID=UPI0015F072A1|nr:MULTISPECIES: RcnB family protein [Paracoccus]MCJ1902637.1 RcnB family protein [Paracoccus versutus]MDF3907226.1 RcnB family protein [Paracoccus sp. AS002]
MKTIPLLALVIALAACSEKDEPTGRIYRYPVGTEARGLEPVVRSGRGVRVDYHNHALPRPDDGQHWELQPGVFLRVDASGRVISTVPARYAGQ